ncbi:ankyrin repeat domain-containing protein [Cellulomonas humilata]|uniref:Ankyrin repeat protein n=1 Tax=Cellulomonas humilata TaxID=144055 RepID=A0ABU0EBT3_9CELL|nr:ankyrin repeat domain-containing protein [Cellulomonas humilata]MDQ0372716.1 ankyrin repeat protein [Cellulomonas humilata]
MATLPTHPDLGHLRRQARALQRAAVAGDPQAADRIARNHPNPPTDLSTFRLSAAQLTVAREYGFPSWPRLRHHLDARAAHSWNPTDEDQSVSAQFCRLACLTYSGSDAPDRRTAARVLLRTHPDLVDDDIWAAAAAARPDVVARLLGRDPTLARRRGGPHGWRPLAYLTYSRVGGGDPVGTARLLLDAGADPDEGYLWHGEPTLFTLLTGVFGEGEGGPVSQPRHPESIALARLLLDRGAEPNDGQTLYNRMFGTDDDHLVLLFAYGLGRGDGGVWRRRLGPEAVDEPRTLVRDLLRWAVQHGQLARVQLLADHGVDLDAPFGDGAWPTGGRSEAPSSTPLSLAATSGDRAVVDLLVSRGAEPGDVPPVDAFVEAAMLGDQDRLAALGDAVAAQARDERPGLIVWAAARGRHDTVALLVDLGFDVNAYGRADVPVEERWETALHAAASLGDPDLVALLLSLGADPTLRDARFGATPLDWAQHLDRPSVIAQLES